MNLLGTLYDCDKNLISSFRLRKGARGFIIKDDKIGILHVKCNDLFGNRDHYETSGGGMEGHESSEETFIREIKEETGYNLANVSYLGTVAYCYSILHVQCLDDFYFGYATSQEERHLTTYEKELNFNLEWFTLAELEDVLTNTKVENVGIQIHKRELMVLKELKKTLQKSKKKIQ